MIAAEEAKERQQTLQVLDRQLLYSNRVSYRYLYIHIKHRKQDNKIKRDVRVLLFSKVHVGIDDVACVCVCVCVCEERHLFMTVRRRTDETTNSLLILKFHHEDTVLYRYYDHSLGGVM